MREKLSGGIIDVAMLRSEPGGKLLEVCERQRSERGMGVPIPFVRDKLILYW